MESHLDEASLTEVLTCLSDGIVDGAPKGLGFSSSGAVVERAGLSEAACASGANPRTCQEARSGLPCCSAEGGNRGGGGELVSQERVPQRTTKHAPMPQFLEERQTR